MGHGDGWFRRIVLGAVLLAVAGCATPETQRVGVDDASLAAEKRKQLELAASEYRAEQNRLSDVAIRVRAAAAPFCGENSSRLLLMGVSSAADARKILRTRDEADAFIAVYHLVNGNSPQITHVAPGSPAALAGLQEGDVLTGINGWTVPDGPNAAGEALAKLREIGKQNIEQFDVKVRRAGGELVLPVRPVPVCGFPVSLQRSQVLNAFADGRRVMITQRMVEFTRSDDELAIVVGHELAHDFMGHLDKQRRNAVLGGIGGFLLDVVLAAGGVNTGGTFGDIGSRAGATAFSQDFEAEADYAGLYAAARAGFNVKVAPDFWRRMGTVDPKSITYATTHPTTAYRALALEKIVTEIEDKEAKGLPLEPETKKPSPPAAPAETPEPRQGD